VTAVEPLPVPGLQLVRPAPGVARQAAIEALEDSPDVLYAEPDAIRRPLALPTTAISATCGATTTWARSWTAAPGAWTSTSTRRRRGT
jgi:hypothetical protein